MIECPNCERNFKGSACRECGWSPNGAKDKRPTSGMPLWTPPVYPEPQPGDEDLIRVQRERLRALFQAPVRRQANLERPVPLRVMLPEIDPLVREEVARREAIAASVSDRVEPPDLADLEVPDW